MRRSGDFLVFVLSSSMAAAPARRRRSGLQMKIPSRQQGFSAADASTMRCLSARSQPQRRHGPVSWRGRRSHVDAGPWEPQGGLRLGAGEHRADWGFPLGQEAWLLQELPFGGSGAERRRWARAEARCAGRGARSSFNWQSSRTTPSELVAPESAPGAAARGRWFRGGPRASHGTCGASPPTRYAAGLAGQTEPLPGGGGGRGTWSVGASSCDGWRRSPSQRSKRCSRSSTTTAPCHHPSPLQQEASWRRMRPPSGWPKHSAERAEVQAAESTAAARAAEVELTPLAFPAGVGADGVVQLEMGRLRAPRDRRAGVGLPVRRAPSCGILWPESEARQDQAEARGAGLVDEDRSGRSRGAGPAEAAEAHHPDQVSVSRPHAARGTRSGAATGARLRHGGTSFLAVIEAERRQQMSERTASRRSPLARAASRR